MAVILTHNLLRIWQGSNLGENPLMVWKIQKNFLNQDNGTESKCTLHVSHTTLTD